MYTYRPKAKHDYDFGNELSYDLSFTSAVTNKINLGIEYNGKYNSKTKRGDEGFKNFPLKPFSGTVGYITPEIEFMPFGKPKLHIGMGVSFLAHYDVKDERPLEKRRYTFRLGYLF